MIHTLKKIMTGFQTEATQNANVDATEAEFALVEYSDGSSTRTGGLDMGGYDLLNLGSVPAVVQQAIYNSGGIAPQAGVTAGDYTNPNVTVNENGVITAIADGASGGGGSAPEDGIMITSDYTITEVDSGRTFILGSASTIALTLGTPTQVAGWKCRVFDSTSTGQHTLTTLNSKDLFIQSNEGNFSDNPYNLEIGSTYDIEYSEVGDSYVVTEVMGLNTDDNRFTQVVSGSSFDIAAISPYGLYMTSTTNQAITLNAVTKIVGWTAEISDVGVVGNFTLSASNDTDYITVLTADGVTSVSGTQTTPIAFAAGGSYTIRYIGSDTYLCTQLRAAAPDAGGGTDLLTEATIEIDTTIIATVPDVRYRLSSASVGRTITLGTATRLSGWSCQINDMLGNTGVDHTLTAQNGTDTIVIQRASGEESGTSVSLLAGESVELRFIGSNTYFGSVTRELISIPASSTLPAFAYAHDSTTATAVSVTAGTDYHLAGLDLTLTPAAGSSVIEVEFNANILGANNHDMGLVIYKDGVIMSNLMGGNDIWDIMSFIVRGSQDYGNATSCCIVDANVVAGTPVTYSLYARRTLSSSAGIIGYNQRSTSSSGSSGFEHSISTGKASQRFI